MFIIQAFPFHIVDLDLIRIFLRTGICFPTLFKRFPSRSPLHLPLSRFIAVAKCGTAMFLYVSVSPALRIIVQDEEQSKGTERDIHNFTVSPAPIV